MIVLMKVGGSLLDWPLLPRRLLESFRLYEGAKIAIVVGGGQAADLVRDFDRIHALGETQAHALALESLNLTARMLAMVMPNSEVVDSVSDLAIAWKRGSLPIVAPGEFMNTIDTTLEDPLPRTWNTTTDSIAARLARTIAADRLVLLKSESILGDGTRAEEARVGYVDANFPMASASFASIDVINLRSYPLRIERLL